MHESWLLTRLEHLPYEQQRRLLLSLAFELTIAARGTYAMQSMEVARPLALRGINEIQHKLIAQATKDSDDSPRYPNEILVEIMYETADQYGCETELGMALSEVHSRLKATD